MKTKIYKKLIISTLLLLTITTTIQAKEKLLGTVDGIPYRLNQWQHQLGNHRILIQVNKNNKAVQVTIPWRRRTPIFKNQEITILDKNNKIITNRKVLKRTQEEITVIFEPTTGIGIYSLYYEMPDLPRMKKINLQFCFPHTYYKPYTKTANQQWLETITNPKNISTAKTYAFEALETFGNPKLKEMNTYYPMEIIATQAETKKIIDANQEKQFILFPEHKEYSIRMTNHLPYRWITNYPKNIFTATAQKGQYFTFQIGVFALQNCKNIKIDFSPLSNNNTTINKNKITCFNLEGNDWLGNHFTKQINIQKQKIQPLWCGIDIPKNIPEGTYQGKITISTQKGNQQSFTIKLIINDKTIANHGDNNPWNLSRLHWLNSKIGIDNKPIKPFIPIKISNNDHVYAFNILGRKITINEQGLPSSAISYISMDKINKKGREILASPIQLQIKIGNKNIKFQNFKMNMTSPKSPNKITFQAISKTKQLTYNCQGTLESDGYMRYSITITANKTINIDDIILSIPYKKDVAKYAMGKFGQSGFMPKPKKVKIAKGMMYNVVWGGDYNAGIGCWLKNKKDEWNADNASKRDAPTLPVWENNQQGFYQLSKNNQATTYQIHNGARTLKTGETVRLDFALLITPFKPLTNFRWENHVYHPRYGSRPVAGREKNANIINLHHATIFNPYINYPFIANKTLKNLIDKFHAEDKKVRIYYTIRELSTNLPELWALRSLGDEIFINHGGYLGSLTKTYKHIRNRNKRFDRSGKAWLAEHLVTNYRVRWHSMIRDNSNRKLSRVIGAEYDASISVQGLSRWHNYYLEGLKWDIEQIGIDGLYLDGIGYDREIMKRVRKTMQQTGKKCTIDFHGAIHNAWMSLAPYIDNIWYGEGAKYQAGPDYWLVEISGIPFGLSGGILAGDRSKTGNHFRGMVHGVTRRIGWSGSFKAEHLWKFLNNFKIEEAQQLGYWDPKCPITSPNPKIKVSVYQKNGESMIVIGSWSKKSEQVKLNIDWKALGLNPKTATATLPQITKHQIAGNIDITKPIQVPANTGLFIIIKK